MAMPRSHLVRPAGALARRDESTQAPRGGQAPSSPRFTADGAVLALAAAGFAVMCGGVVLLTQTAPATMKADIPSHSGGGGQHGAANSQDQPARN